MGSVSARRGSGWGSGGQQVQQRVPSRESKKHCGPSRPSRGQLRPHGVTSFVSPSSLSFHPHHFPSSASDCRDAFYRPLCTPFLLPLPGTGHGLPPGGSAGGGCWLRCPEGGAACGASEPGLGTHGPCQPLRSLSPDSTHRASLQGLRVSVGSLALGCLSGLASVSLTLRQHIHRNVTNHASAGVV